MRQGGSFPWVKPLQISHSIFLILSFWVSVAFCVTTSSSSVTSFNIEAANKRYDSMVMQLAAQRLSSSTLKQYIAELTQLSEQAQACVEETTSKIEELDTQAKQFFGDKAVKAEAKGEDAHYLLKQKQALRAKQAQCRLFLMRATESLDTYHQTALSLQQQKTFSRGSTIIDRFKQIPKQWKGFQWPRTNGEMTLSFYHLFLYLGLCFLLAFFIRLGMYYVYSYSRMPKNWRFGLKPLMFISCFSALFGATLLFNQPFVDKNINESFNSLLLTTLLFMAVLLAYRMLFMWPRFCSLCKWCGIDIAFLRRLGLTILLLYFVHQLGLEALAVVSAPQLFTRLYEELLLITSLFLMSYFTLRLYHDYSAWFKKHVSGVILYQSLLFVVVILITLDFIGYSTLAQVASGVLFAFILVSALGMTLYLVVGKAYHLVSYHQRYQALLKYWFGYVGTPPYFELLLLKLVVQLVVLASMCFLFSQLIGEIGYLAQHLLQPFFYGFHIATYHIVPVQWVLGIIAFGLLSLLSRYVATRVSRKQQFHQEEDAQVAIASIILYIGFSLSIIISLLLAGFSFTSLAIIAGALSVGIGLGLQSIVNNFLSGLILLIEKPIKAGDRIKIDNIEGFVKKVRVRSTHVVTPAQEDIIIPNSDFITHQVTNFMFSDNHVRIKCVLGVAYDSDIDNVSQTMKAVALAHPEVIKEGSYQPLVLFSSFGESVLLFELWCIITDVNKKAFITSDLNFALYKACRENEINIAYPQRDVHLKFD